MTLDLIFSKPRNITILRWTFVPILTYSSSSKPHKSYNVLSCNISILALSSSLPLANCASCNSAHSSLRGIPSTGSTVEMHVLVSTAANGYYLDRRMSLKPVLRSNFDELTVLFIIMLIIYCRLYSFNGRRKIPIKLRFFVCGVLAFL